MEKVANANRNIFLLIPVEFPVFWDRLDRGIKTPQKYDGCIQYVKASLLRGKHDPVKKHQPLGIWATLGEPTFYAFPYKTCCTVSDDPPSWVTLLGW